MTTRLSPEEYLKYWESAQAEEIGICVQVEPEDQHKFVNALYECRKTFGGFEGLLVFQPQPLGTIFIAHKTNAELLP